MIGIIGQGFVGNAVYQKFSSFYEVFTYDLDKDKCNSSLSDVIFKCGTIFVCVPTPMKKDGSCDTSIIESILGEVDLLVDNIEAKRTIIIKSTIPPGTTARFNNRYESLSIVFNPDEQAENLRKYGGFIPGIRPGENTSIYIDYVLTRLTIVGSIYLTLVALLPEFLISKTSIPFYLGGTSLLIVVVVMIDFINQVQSHLFQHQYEGLLKKTKLKGRR